MANEQMAVSVLTESCLGSSKGSKYWGYDHRGRESLCVASKSLKF